MNPDPSATGDAGLLLNVAGELVFLPPDVAVRVEAFPRVTPVAGAGGSVIGLANIEGEILPVFAIGEARSHLVLCMYRGELLGIVGGVPVAAGLLRIEGAPDDKEHPSTSLPERNPMRTVVQGPVRRLDLADFIEQSARGGWAGRQGT